MPSVKVKVVNVKELQKALQKKSLRAIDSVEKAVNSGALAIHGTAIKLVQKGPRSGITYPRQKGSKTHTASAPGEPPKTDTGNLVSNIKLAVGKDGPMFVARIIADTPYAKWLEFGTAQNGGPRPFMQPAFQKHERQIRKDIQFALNKGLGL